MIFFTHWSWFPQEQLLSGMQYSSFWLMVWTCSVYALFSYYIATVNLCKTLIGSNLYVDINVGPYCMIKIEKKLLRNNYAV